jgi:hypothetical protein
MRSVDALKLIYCTSTLAEALELFFEGEKIDGTQQERVNRLATFTVDECPPVVEWQTFRPHVRGDVTLLNTIPSHRCWVVSNVCTWETYCNKLLSSGIR